MLEPTTLLISATFALGYLIGSIPFGLVLTRLAGLGDIRSVGSGNIGATNVLRTGSKKLAAATLLLDILKGAAPILLAAAVFTPTDSHSSAHIAIAAGVGAFLGHCFPVWLGFKGGKGVATYIGVLAGWAWPASLAFCGVWLATAIAFRFSSLSALVAALTSPFLIMGLGAPTLFGAASAILSVVLIAKHHANISRLLNGQEPKIGAKS